MNKKIIPILLIILELIGTSMSLSHGMTSLIYYTVDSNILNLISCICFVFFSEKQWAKNLRYVATCCLTLTFLIVVFVLCPMEHSMKLLYQGEQLYHHLLCPILSFVSFCFIEKPKDIKVSYALLPTLIYAVIMIFGNIINVVEGPYPFLMVHNQPIWASCLWTVVILGICLGIAKVVKRISE